MRYAFALFLLALPVLVACSDAPTATPTTEPAAPPAASGPLVVTLTSDAGHYSSSEANIRLTASNDGGEPVYLPVCGPWEIIPAGDPDRPAWSLECEIDYLGYELLPGQDLAGDARLQLQPATYRARIRVYGDCTLGEPKEIDASEIYYGEFGDCAIGQEVLSAAFVAE